MTRHLVAFGLTPDALDAVRDLAREHGVTNSDLYRAGLVAAFGHADPRIAALASASRGTAELLMED